MGWVQISPGALRIHLVAGLAFYRIDNLSLVHQCMGDNVGVDIFS